MSAIPPKHGPEGQKAEDVSGNMLAMYQAGQSDTASFPVLQAFQKYIDQERAQARKRVAMISLCFSLLLVFLLTLFIVIGFFLFNRADNSQTKLLDALLARQQPVQNTVAPQAAPPAQPAIPKALTDSLQQMAKATDAIHDNIEEQRKDARALSKKTDDALAKQNAELKKRDAEMAELRKELKRMRDESASLKKSISTMKEDTRKEVLSSLAKQQAKRPNQWQKGSSSKVPSARPQPPAGKGTPPQAKASTPGKPAVTAAAKPQSVPPPPSPFPKATKAPPEVTPGLKPPATPKGMMSTKIPIETKKSGTVPWRVMLPE